MDRSCDRTECCCPVDEVTISKANDREMLVSSSVAGVPCQRQLNGSTTIKVNIPIPQDMNGYQVTTNFLGTNNRFTLTYDGQYIANVNMESPRCSGSARRKQTNTNAATTLSNSVAALVVVMIASIFS